MCWGSPRPAIGAAPEYLRIHRERGFVQHGVFANRSRHRSGLPLPPTARDHQAQDNANAHLCSVDSQLDDTLTGQQTALALEPDDPDGDMPAVRPRRLPWASLLKRSLGIDGLECPSCQAQMVLLALITAPATVAKILDHLRLPSAPPPVAPARLGAHQAHLAQQSTLLDDDLDQSGPLDQSDPLDEPTYACFDHSLGGAVPRAP